jgi:hypothetical protein
VLREENGGLRGALQKAQEGAHLAAETKLTNEKISQMQQELTMSYKARPSTPATRYSVSYGSSVNRLTARVHSLTEATRRRRCRARRRTPRCPSNCMRYKRSFRWRSSR